MSETTNGLHEDVGDSPEVEEVYRDEFQPVSLPAHDVREMTPIADLFNFVRDFVRRHLSV
jgi:hypothetical protein